MIYKNIKKLHSDDVLRLKALAPFSEAENKKLMAISSVIQILLELSFISHFYLIACQINRTLRAKRTSLRNTSKVTKQFFMNQEFQRILKGSITRLRAPIYLMTK
jgi:hypothetical protein